MCMSNDALQILKQYWKYNAFRGEQANIIQAVLAKKDVLALLPTGGGKSVCFQVPPLLLDGLCLVISPLIALMKDQVENLHKKNIQAVAITSGMSFFDVKQTLQQATQGAYKFLYISPERLATNLFKDYLPALNICLIAVDEAHCISQWGYDFRPPYLKIATLRNELPNVPIIALTASATPIVQKDIIDKLLLNNANVFAQSFEKPKLSFSVFKVASQINKALEILQKVNGSSIIYCKNRKETKKVALLLQQHQISSDYYHAGLTQKERSEKQNNWIQNKIRVMVCTNAFGMGIDKPDVRTVIHFHLTDCLENYYQEAGRAGRDGKKAYAILLYQIKDEEELAFLPDSKFPTIEAIKKVYQAIANYLQIPEGTGEGNYYDFDLLTFCNNFKLEANLVINTLKLLENQGHITFNENVFLQSKVVFTADKHTINNIENTHPQLELVMKTLLRTYEGIYENAVTINEKLLAKVCKLPYSKIHENLQALHQQKIIEYTQQKNAPQLFFILNRAPVSSLYIDMKQYEERKKLYKQRIDTLREYIHLSTACRSKFIANYFGDTTVRNCNFCDNCIANHKQLLAKGEFKKIEQQILQTLKQHQLTLKELLNKLPAIKQEKVLHVLDFLQNEKIIITDSKNLLQIKIK